MEVKMRINCNKIKIPKAKLWFAWYPVEMKQNECVWLEFIWRFTEEHQLNSYSFKNHRYSYTEYGEYTK
jgi:hypothetical protein